MVAVFLTVLAAFVFTEFVGYWIHVLLHSNRIGFLSRNHMIHHLRDYSPKTGMRRSGPYLNGARDRPAILGIGLEWVAPIAGVSILALLGLNLLAVPIGLQIVFMLVSYFWAFALFGYMHEAMHLQNFWMERVPVLKTWFLNARKNHDIHHLQISNDGKMNRNYGICFFFFDRLLGSYRPRHEKFNEAGYQTAIQRYATIIGK